MLPQLFEEFHQQYNGLFVQSPTIQWSIYVHCSITNSNMIYRLIPQNYQVTSTTSGRWRRMWSSPTTGRGWLGTGTSGYQSDPFRFTSLSTLMTSIIVFFFYLGRNWRPSPTQASTTCASQLVTGPGRSTLRSLSPLRSWTILTPLARFFTSRDSLSGLIS